jgi:glycosyltransferase involved in cell wall biosynthesis
MTKSKITLSIVILAYNEEAYISRCLDSIADQTVMPDEVIVVDNNSSDDTAAIAASYPFVTIIKETEQGMMPARNRGFNSATGDFIARIDADTSLPEGWVAAAHQVIDSHVGTICGFSGPAYVYDLPSERAGKLMGNLILKQGFFRGSKLMLGHETLYGSNMIISAPAWAKVKDEVCQNSLTMHEDIDLALHIGQYGDIHFDDSLIAGVSKRGFLETPRKVWWRLRIWPTTVSHHRKLFANLRTKTKV